MKKRNGPARHIQPKDVIGAVATALVILALSASRGRTLSALVEAICVAVIWIVRR